MEKLKNTHVSTLMGTFFILASALPLIAYMQYFKVEAAKESVHATPTWMSHWVAKK